MPNTGDFAIIIGINNYLNLAPLDGPINDADEFYKWLVDLQGGALPAENCFLIPNKVKVGESPRPLQDDIDDTLESIVTRDNVGFRRFYFFFAGHGLGVAWDQNGLCLPKWSIVQRNYALSSKGLSQLFGRSLAIPRSILFSGLLPLKGNQHHTNKHQIKCYTTPWRKCGERRGLCNPLRKHSR